MAVQRRSNDPELDALIAAAAMEVRHFNPYIEAPAPAFTEQEGEDISREDHSLADLWNTPEGQRAQQLGISAADLVDEDRGA